MFMFKSQKKYVRVSLVITTYNRPDALYEVLKSVNNQTVLPVEVIIADDGSKNTTKELIEKYKKESKLNLIHSWQEDIGFRAARSRNKAIIKALGEYIILIDGDMILNENFINDHIKNSRKGFFIQGTRTLLSKSLTQEILNGNKVNINFFQKNILNRKNSIRSLFLSKIFSGSKNSLFGIKTCNMSFFLHDFYLVNGFNNDIEGWGREDSEFCSRLMNAGIRRKNLRFGAIQYHLWHGLENRKSLKNNDLILKNTIDQKLTWCKSGANEIKNEY